MVNLESQLRGLFDRRMAVDLPSPLLPCQSWVPWALLGTHQVSRLCKA